MKRVFIPLLVTMLIGACLSVHSAASQEAEVESSRPSIPPEVAELADKYAEEQSQRARSEERETFRQKRKRWTQMVRDAYERFEKADERLDRVGGYLDDASKTDPEIARIESEIRGRIDRAERWVGRWADVESVAKALPEGFANVAAGRLGLRLDFGGGAEPKNELLPPQGELLPPANGGETPGWFTEAMNSEAAAGAGGSGVVLILLYMMKRMRDKDKEEGDQRNDRVTEAASERAFERWQSKQAASGGGGDGGGR